MGHVTLAAIAGATRASYTLRLSLAHLPKFCCFFSMQILYDLEKK